MGAGIACLELLLANEQIIQLLGDYTMKSIIAIGLLASSGALFAQATEEFDAAAGPMPPHNPDAMPTGPNGAAPLYSNGPVLNSTGTGPGGADESILYNLTLGMTTLGAAGQQASGNRMADDFEVTGSNPWQIDTIDVYAYQTGAPSAPSPITGVTMEIWDGDPSMPGSSIVWGDSTTNVMMSTEWTGIYRVAESTPGDTLRSIMRVTAAVDVQLPPGTYWISYGVDGSGAFSGPWIPPIASDGVSTTTGNGLQFFMAAWQNFNDGGTGTQQGLPFNINGTIFNPYVRPEPVPAMSVWSLLLMTGLFAGIALVSIRSRS